MVDVKTLPPLPIENPSNLSVDARSHRLRLIRHLLSDAHDTAIDKRRDAWTAAFEDVLDDFGSCLHSEDWLSAFKKSSELRRIAWQKQHAELERKIREQAAKHRRLVKAMQMTTGDDNGRKEVGKKSAQGAESLHKDEEPSQSHKPPTSQIRSEKCLFLSVAPLGARFPLPSEDSGFILVPSDVGCVFVPGTFTLPDAQEVKVLYGSNDWMR